MDSIINKSCQYSLANLLIVWLPLEREREMESFALPSWRWFSLGGRTEPVPVCRIDKPDQLTCNRFWLPNGTKLSLIKFTQAKPCRGSCRGAERRVGLSLPAGGQRLFGATSRWRHLEAAGSRAGRPSASKQAPNQNPKRDQTGGGGGGNCTRKSWIAAIKCGGRALAQLHPFAGDGRSDRSHREGRPSEIKMPPPDRVWQLILSICLQVSS